MGAPVFAALAFSAEDDPYDDGLGYQEKLQQLSQNFTLLANYNATLELQIELGIMGYIPQGGWDASGNAYPAGVDKGSWIVTDAGTLGGEAMEPGEFFIYTGSAFVNRKIVLGNIQADLTPALGGELDGLGNSVKNIVLKSYGEKVNIIGAIGGGAQNIDLTLGGFVTATVDTAATSFTFSGAKAAGIACGFTLLITNGGSQAVTWPASLKWAGATAPSLTTAGVDVLAIFTIDGGVTWHGMIASADSK